MSPAEPAKKQLIHLVGRLTDVVFSFLGPATEALAKSGYSQTVVLMEDPRASYLAGEFSSHVELIVIKDDSRWRRWSQAAPLVWRLLKENPQASVHFHGILPLMFGGLLSRLARSQGKLLYSPHGSRAHSHWPALGNALLVAGGWVLGSARMATIDDSMPSTGSSAPIAPRLAVERLASPVADVFFSQPRAAVEPPEVLVCGPEDEAGGVVLACQLAAVFSGHPGAPIFRWLGTPHDANSVAQLKAAGVSALPIGASADRAALLSRASVFLAAGPSRGFAVHLAEAMAAGVPCVAATCESHRVLLNGDANGLMFDSETEAYACVAALIDSPTKRAHLSSAAREAALARHSKGQFNASILNFYGNTATRHEKDDVSA